MGIARLSQDVSAYTETVLLGKDAANQSTIKVTNIVIDGPSLVYHVFNMLLRTPRTSELSHTEGLPSYRLINTCILQFLEDLTSSGVRIERIIFDGALPMSKRPTRLERLEKTRQYLDTFRKVHPFKAPQGAFDLAQIGPGTNVPGPEATSLQRLLWSCSATTTGQTHLLPPPPFMVASAIEILSQSRWSANVHIVPGEADAYCASEAKALSCAILSNDSDLMLYDLGRSGIMVSLHTVEPTDVKPKQARCQLKAQCIRPLEVAKLLKVPELLVFAYHRYLDSSASSSVVSQRAREQTLAEDDKSWIEFRREYRDLATGPLNRPQPATCMNSSIQGLDPRTSEMVCSVIACEGPHMYLLPLLEDPTKDSAWSYGVELRQLAYSILSSIAKTDHDSKQFDHVTEHTRKGPRIAESGVTVLSQTALKERIEQVKAQLTYYLENRAKISNVKDEALSTSITIKTSAQDVVLSYYLLALELTISSRLARSKAYETTFSRLCPVDASFSSTKIDLTWDDIHFHASTLSVLYSLRLLKQILDYTSRSLPHTERRRQKSALQDAISELHTLIQDMPNITDLFIEAASFRQKLLSFPRGTIKTRTNKMLDRADPGRVKKNREAHSQSKHTTQPDDTETQWEMPRTEARKMAKRQRIEERFNKLPTSIRTSNKHSTNVTSLNSNVFALLQEQETKSEEDSNDSGR